jgi:aspartate carbamoyltransferase catalytic subunit
MAHMHDHAAWLKDGMTGADEQAVKTYQFFMRVDPDMRDFLGPIERVQDERTGREMRTRKARVATLRGQKEENMQDVVVYLDPLPHIRVKNAKDLQGWYQAKQEQRSGSRVRPCFTPGTEDTGGVA